MKPIELRCGQKKTLELQWDDASIQLSKGDEVKFSRFVNDIHLIQKGQSTSIQISGSTPTNKQILLEIVDSGLPYIAYVLKSGANGAIFEVRQYVQRLVLNEKVWIGVDDKIVRDVHKKYHITPNVHSVCAFLADQVLMASFDDLEKHRIVLSARPDDVKAFRIFGYHVNIDVINENGKLYVQSVVGAREKEIPRLNLFEATIDIVDQSVSAGSVDQVRTVLEEAIAEKESYLNAWRKYQQIENDLLNQKARLIGNIQYTKCHQDSCGNWLFTLAESTLLENQIKLIQAEKPNLEAAANKMTFSSTGEAEKKEGIQFSGKIGQVDMQTITVCYSDDEQPEPPDSGFLYVSLIGDRRKLRRRQMAEEALRSGTCPMPRLGLLIEGRPVPSVFSRKYSVDSPKIKDILKRVFGNHPPTQNQMDAIEMALNTPDICLIQGPPGTGKTKVIVALENIIAELNENIDLDGITHQILSTSTQHDAVDNLVQRTMIFGLPAVKVGGKRGSTGFVFDPVQNFMDEKVQLLKSIYHFSESEKLTTARKFIVAKSRQKMFAEDYVKLLNHVLKLLNDQLSPALHDLLQKRIRDIQKPAFSDDVEERELQIKAIRGIRVEPSSFSDDGPINARKALHRLDAILQSDERVFLEECSEWDSDEIPAFLAKGEELKLNLMDRVVQAEQQKEPYRDDETIQLLLNVLSEIKTLQDQYREGEQAALYSYVEDLELDPDGFRETIRHYTTVLAATLQQAMGRKMKETRGIDTGTPVFENVIVDEAARAHPLDLFIAMSMAKRKVILVGDHRQLPHLLEPNVTSEIQREIQAGSIKEEFETAVKESLFEKLLCDLQELEQKDLISRTCRLDTQFRMHPKLGEFVSSNFYDGGLLSPSDVRPYVHNLASYSGKYAQWIDVPQSMGMEQTRDKSKYRSCEASIIASEVYRLLNESPDLTIGVIAFYDAQVNEIGKALVQYGVTEINERDSWDIAPRWINAHSSEGKKVERLRIGSVDAFQGKEFDVVLLSITRSNNIHALDEWSKRLKYGHLMLQNRLCVAMSRQKKLLIAVGDRAFIQQSEDLPALRNFVTLCGDVNI